MHYYAKARSGVYIVGQSAEHADIENRSGHIVGERFSVMFERTDGKRLAGPGAETQHGAERLAAALQRTIDKGWNPETAWGEIEPAYGSAYYEASGEELIRAELERRDG